MNNSKLRDFVLAGVASTLVGGTLMLAVIDKDYRSSFIDLAKVGVSGYIGLTLPKSKPEEEKPDPKSKPEEKEPE